jgi:hypothetical protein
MHGSVLGVPVSQAAGMLLPNLFLAVRFVLVPCYSFLHLANPRKGSKDKENILRQIEKNRKRKINDKN